MLNKGRKAFLLALAFCFAFEVWIEVTATELQNSKASQNSKVWALAIGVSRYPKLPGGQQLQFADRDAQSFIEALKKTGISSENIRALVGQEATASAIKSAMGNWLARAAAPDDTVYIFFSGHGLVEREFGESYFLAQDSDLKDPYSTAISITELSNAITRRFRARRVMIIADAIRRDLFPPDGNGEEDAKTFANSLNQIAQSRPGASAMLANSPGEFSREGQRWGGLGVFTKFLVEGLAGEADHNRDGAITSGEIFDFVSAKVIEDTSNRQRPWKTEIYLADSVLGQSQTVARITSPTDADSRPSEQVSQRPGNLPSQTARPERQPQTINPTVQPPGANETQKSEPSQQRANPVESVAAISPPVVSGDRREKHEAVPRAEEKVTKTTEHPKPKPITPPTSERIEARNPSNERTAATEVSKMESANLPPPPRPAIVPPSTGSINPTSTARQPSPSATSLPETVTGNAPSPLVLQLEAAIAAGDLIEPRNASAWDIYQKLANDQASSIEVARLKPRLADALEKSGIAIIRSGALSDKVTDRVDDFRRAGQMFARARAIAPEKADLANLEKLSAVQALIALQFFDEAERSLSQMQNTRSAEIENALGMVYQGKFDNWRSERAFKRAIEIDAGWYVPHYNLGLLLKSQNNELAIESLARAAELTKDNISVLTAFGDECMSRQQWQRAVDTYRKAVEQKPDDDDLRTKLANALYSAGHRDEANREYQKASELRKKRH